VAVSPSENDLLAGSRPSTNGVDFATGFTYDAAGRLARTPIVRCITSGWTS
jgi:hypothetical protein